MVADGWVRPDSIPTRFLVYGMVREDGRLRTSDVLPVAEICGLTREQVRSCLRRLVDQGSFTRTNPGRDAEYEPTEAGKLAVTVAMDRYRMAVRYDAAGEGWDRNWHLIGFAIPEAHRSARASFRDWLLRNGAAPIQGGLYVSPHGRAAETRHAAANYGLGDYLVQASTERLTVGDVSDPGELASTLWPLEEIAQGYRAFIDRFAPVPQALGSMRERGQTLSNDEFLAGAFAMLVELYACQRADPLLPPELLARDWPGRKARRLAAQCRQMGMQRRSDPTSPVPFPALDDQQIGLL